MLVRNQGQNIHMLSLSLSRTEGSKQRRVVTVVKDKGQMNRSMTVGCGHFASKSVARRVRGE